MLLDPSPPTLSSLYKLYSHVPYNQNPNAHCHHVQGSHAHTDGGTELNAPKVQELGLRGLGLAGNKEVYYIGVISEFYRHYIEII